jgi:hypothetical protein
MKQHTLALFFTLVGLFSTFFAHAQIDFWGSDEIPLIKKGITYVVMKDTVSPKVKPFMKVIRENWTLSKVKFIKTSELEQYLTPDDAYLTLSVELRSRTDKRQFTTYWGTYFLELWMVKDEFFEKNKKKLKDKFKLQTARFELYANSETVMNYPSPDYFEFDGGGRFYNWSPGFLKNHIQVLMHHFKKKENRGLRDFDTNPKQIKRLREETLFIPDYVLIKVQAFTGAEVTREEEDGLFEDYKHPYQLISTADLDQKILNAKEDFFYLAFIKSSTGKYIYVVNGLTGDVIDSNGGSAIYNFRSNDLRILSETISSAK